jgi:hypothetical protein
MRSVSFCLMIALLLCSVPVGAQTTLTAPATIVLLPGYQHAPVPTPRDSRNGRIFKDQGLSISYQAGGLSGNRINGNPNLLWSKETTVRGNRVQIGMTRDRMLIVVFSALAPPPGVPGSALPANFYATVNSEEDIADMMFMVMTYSPT